MHVYGAYIGLSHINPPHRGSRNKALYIPVLADLVMLTRTGKEGS